MRKTDSIKILYTISRFIVDEGSPLRTLLQLLTVTLWFSFPMLPCNFVFIGLARIGTQLF